MTRSPGRAAARETGRPYDFWALALCGSITPTWRNTYWVSPEQSNRYGPAAPNWYHLPVCAAAIASTRIPSPAGYGRIVTTSGTETECARPYPPVYARRSVDE